MLKSPRTLAHIGLGMVITGLFLYIIFPTAYWFSLALWGLAFIFGIITLAKNGRAFPNSEQIIGRDSLGLDLLGYIEVYVSFVPVVVAIATILYFMVLKSGI